MIMFEDEFGATVYIFFNEIKFIKENKGGPFEQVHTNAKSVIGTVHGDTFYSRDTLNDILERVQTLVELSNKGGK